jgi:hypothetical protein
MRLSSHHHESRPSLLEVIASWPSHTRSQRGHASLSSRCVPLAIRPAIDLEITITEDDAASRAREAFGVELLALVGFQVLALDSKVARITQRTIELVVVLLAVGGVVEDVEFCTWERVSAGSANEAISVISTCKTTRGIFDRLADNGFRTTSTLAFGRCGGTAIREISSGLFGNPWRFWPLARWALPEP